MPKGRDHGYVMLDVRQVEHLCVDVFTRTVFVVGHSSDAS